MILENKSNKLVSISLDKLFFSGIEIEALISCDIPPKSSSNEYIYIESINSLEDFNDKIEGTFNTLNTIKDYTNIQWLNRGSNSLFFMYPFIHIIPILNFVFCIPLLIYNYVNSVFL